MVFFVKKRIKIECMKPEQLANKWIQEMQECGLTSNAMLHVIKLAKNNYLKLKNSK
jgi:hypothetical protein